MILVPLGVRDAYNSSHQIQRFYYYSILPLFHSLSFCPFRAVLFGLHVWEAMALGSYLLSCIFFPFVCLQEVSMERFVNHDALGRIGLAGVPCLVLLFLGFSPLLGDMRVSSFVTAYGLSFSVFLSWWDGVLKMSVYRYKWNRLVLYIHMSDNVCVGRRNPGILQGDDTHDVDKKNSILDI